MIARLSLDEVEPFLEACSDRDKAEIARSAIEAKGTILHPSDVGRYLNPGRDTPFPLEYSFFLLGDVTGKTILDLGCGTGENIPPLLARGGRVIGLDISPDLIALAEQRLAMAGLTGQFHVGSAYSTGLPDSSVDIIFCIAVIHHLEIPRVRIELTRVLRKGGFIILREPIRFSRTVQRLRRLFPAQEEISDYEHPLTRAELDAMMKGFEVTGTRYFRLPFVPLIKRAFLRSSSWPTHASNWLIRNIPAFQRYATVVVTKLGT